VETPNSTSGDRSTRRLRRPALVMVALAGLLTLTGAATAPTASAAPGDLRKIAKLTKEIKNLEKSYGGSLEQLRDARYDAKKALDRAQDLRTDLEKTRALVTQLAASQYMTSGVDPTVQLLTSADPGEMLTSAAQAQYISQTKAAKVQQIQALVAQQDKARKEAQAKIEKLEKDMAEVKRQRLRVERLLRKYKPESPMVGSGGMTSRMIKVRDEIETELGPFPTIGCTRPGDPQDHGTGRACDFMESTAGAMPTAERLAHGDSVAAYAIRNASRLGIKYIIWKQRIYDLRSPGWKGMSDRGSITQNHFDHVHISVF
jgi:uncharacterized protein YlxW (UPF0749 family)